MILSSLRDMAIREGLTGATAFENKPVKWVISLDEDGRFLGLSQTLTDSLPEEGNKKRKPQAKMFSIPRRSGRTRQTEPEFLVDKSEYVLGIEPTGAGDIKELEKRRSLFLDKIAAAARATGIAGMTAIAQFLTNTDERANCAAALNAEGYATDDLFAFKVDGEIVHSNSSVRAYWTSIAEGAGEFPKNDLRQCVVCGEMRHPVRLHDQVSGLGKDKCAFVSFKEEAFWKYGLEHKDNAPTCRVCMTAYIEAVRRCLSDRYPRPDDPEMSFPKQSVWLAGNTSAIFWADAPSGVVSGLAHLGDGPAEVKAALESPWTGKSSGTIEHQQFHCIIVTGARGRAILRGIHTCTLGELIANLKTYFECLAVPHPLHEIPIPISKLLGSLTAAKKGDNLQKHLDKLPPGLAADVFLAAVVGRPLPRRVLSSAVARNAATQSVTRERAALLHLYFVLQPNTEKPPMSLDVNNPDPAYRLGRLLAVLEAIQYQAQGTLNKNVVNRFYSAAATRPGSVFPRMLELTQHHLAKLPTGSRISRQKQLGEVVNELIAFSPMQTLEEQGRFALGYYHQRYANFQKVAPEAAPTTNTAESTNEEGAE
jgi:CRISPR-associated protein Csd1